MRKRSIARVVGLAVFVLAFAGCSSKQTDTNPLLPTDGGSAEFIEEDFTESVSGPVRVPELKTVYFEYDRFNVKPDMQPVVRNNAMEIQRRPEWKQIVLEGHCDERGTEEYNLALGDKRANAVADDYIRMGVPGAKIVTVSFGSSRPAVQGHDESAWRFNRRVETLVNK